MKTNRLLPSSFQSERFVLRANCVHAPSLDESFPLIKAAVCIVLHSFFSSFLFLIKIEEKKDANFLNSNCNNLPNDRNNRNNLNSYEQSFLFFLQSVCTLWAIVASINALDIDNIYAFKYILVYVYYIRNSSYRFGARRNLSILLPQDVILYTPASS